VLEDASAVHFHLLDEVLNVPLHGMQVRFDGVKRDPVLAVPRFETVRFKFSCAINAYGLGILPPEPGKLVQVPPWVLARFSIDHSTEVGPYIQHHKRISNSVPQWGAESAPARRWLPAAGGDRAWAARTGSGPMRMCGDIFAAARLWRGRLLTTGRLSCRHPIVVCGTWHEGLGGGAVGTSVGVLRARRCHLRAGFQQCKSFVEMGTVRCCPL
jgi:hypothetical protein